jgi:hypothetical protein
MEEDTFHTINNKLSITSHHPLNYDKSINENESQISNNINIIDEEIVQASHNVDNNFYDVV